MREFNQKRAVFFLVVSFSLTLILGACSPAKMAAPPQATTRFSSISEKAASCEAKLRSQMEAKELSITSIPELAADIQAANAIVKATDNTEYNATMTSEVESLEVSHSALTSTTYNKVAYDLKKPASFAEAAMVLEINAESIVVHKSTHITQRIQVSESCELKITETSKAVLQRVTEQDYSYDEKVYYPNGETNPFSDQFSLPIGSAEIANLWLDRDAQPRMPKEAGFYIPRLGAVVFNTTDLPAQKASEFGQEFDFSFQNAAVSKDGQVVLTIKLGVSSDQQTTVSDNGNSKEWKISKAIWENLLLGTTRDTSSQVHSELTLDYQYKNPSILLTTDQLPTYDHFAAYWKLDNKTQDPETKKWTYTLTEMSSPEITGRVTPEDLASNDTVQTELPQIQAAAKDILAKAPTGRREQIALILKYLGDNYKYDYEMLKNNTVRVLTTEDALNRKTGVCQHYAVIFTAIARALKIPSRIVVGYSVNGPSLGGHAWVEAEVSPNTWRVIEPQSVEGLTQTNTRFYFPMVRGKFLEDKKANALDYSVLLMNFKADFKQVN